MVMIVLLPRYKIFTRHVKFSEWNSSFWRLVWIALFDSFIAFLLSFSLNSVCAAPTFSVNVDVQPLDADFSNQVTITVQNKEFTISKHLAKQSATLKNLINADSDQNKFQIGMFEPKHFQWVIHNMNSINRPLII